MKYQNEKNYSKDNFLKNGAKNQQQFSKNSFVSTIEQPALNESGVEAKKKGF